MKIVLFQPQIPQNTGNVVRTCSVAGCGLVLVRPLGFSLHDRWLKRAGLDYWEEVAVDVVDDLPGLLGTQNSNFYFFSSKAKLSYSEIKYTDNDWLIFGSETVGLPQEFFDRWHEKFVKIPMKDGKRCLNLATSVGIAVYEAKRQTGFHFG